MAKKIDSLQTIAIKFIENKNNENFKNLINRLNPGLSSYAYGFVKDKDISDEIVSETFISIWKKIEQYIPSKGCFSTWAYSIAKNESLGVLRKMNKTVSYDMYSENNSRELQASTPVFNMNTECMLPAGEELTQMIFDVSLSIIHTLDEPYKTVMIERAFNQKQLSDIADELGWNLSTVKTRLRKARKDVAEVMYKKYPDLVSSYFGNDE